MNMQRSMRHVVIVIMVCFVALFVQLNRVQVFDAEALSKNPANTRTVQKDFSRARGPIVTADGEVIARSVPSEGAFDYQREYPHGELYAHLTGYLSFNLGAEGLERSYSDELLGRTAAQQLDGLSGILADQDPTGELVLSIRHDLQIAARDALGGRDGSVVAIEPATGRILAMWSNPSFDPNQLAVHDGVTANEAYAGLSSAEGNPLRARAYRDIFFPGSTFKVVTAAAALSTGVATLDAPVFAPAAEYYPPLTSRPISNFGGATCGGDLLELMRVSCNTGFAELGAGMLGPTSLINQAEAFGFNRVPPIDLPGAVASKFPDDFGEELEAPTPEQPAGVFEDSARLAQASIGQNDVSASPLQMALTAAAVANDGVMMEPRVVDEVRDRKGEAVITYDSDEWLRPVGQKTASELRALMVEVVQSGTARSVSRTGVLVGAKTGTAQVGTVPPTSHAWMIAFAGNAENQPGIALAVLVEASDDATEQTGGRVAGPIVNSLLSTYLDQ